MFSFAVLRAKSYPPHHFEWVRGGVRHGAHACSKACCGTIGVLPSDGSGHRRSSKDLIRQEPMLSAPRRFGLSGSLPLHRTARRADRSLRRRPWYPVYMRFPACIADLGSPVTSGVGSPLFQQRLLSGRSIRFSRGLNLYGNFVLNHQGARYGLSDCPRYSVAVERADSSRVIMGLIVRGLPFMNVVDRSNSNRQSPAKHPDLRHPPHFGACGHFRPLGFQCEVTTPTEPAARLTHMASRTSRTLFSVAVSAELPALG
jgi:hypothetical protein